MKGNIHGNSRQIPHRRRIHDLLMNSGQRAPAPAESVGFTLPQPWLKGND